MKSLLQLTILAIVATSFTGCSRFRELTRRDYALMRDPFASRADETATAAADSDRPPVPGMSLSPAGFARVDGGNKTELSDKATANYSNVVAANPAEPAGVSSTKFPGVRVNSMGESVAVKPAVADDNPFAEAVRTASASSRSSGNSPEESPDMASLAKFMEDQAKASGLTDTANELSKDLSQFSAKHDKWETEANMARRVLAENQAKAGRTGAGEKRNLADFARIREQEWHKELAAKEEKAAPLIQSVGQANQTVKQVAGQSKDSVNAVTNSVFNQAAKVRSNATEKAQPFLSNSQQVTPARPQKRAASPPPIGEANPFAAMEAAIDKPQHSRPPASAFKTPPPSAFHTAPASSPRPEDPFEAFDAAISQRASAAVTKPEFTEQPFGSEAPSTSGKTLDAGFSFDSGWRPSTYSRP